ncbi:MAG: flavodoxin family protein [Desulfobacterales bacterium]
MKVLAFNGSPRKAKGATDRILQQFMEGAREAGADTETIYLADHRINYCTGCFNCWLVRPGTCVHNDDMPAIQEKMDHADVLVYASPVYVDGVTGQMKTFMDRHITRCLPFIEIANGHMRHPRRREDIDPHKMVFISTCGFGEMDNFDPIVQHMEAAAKNMRAEFVGALVRPMGPVMETMEEMAPESVRPVYEAFQKAGFECVSTGGISEESTRAASKPLMTNDEFLAFANPYFQGEIDKNKKESA